MWTAVVRLWSSAPHNEGTQPLSLVIKKPTKLTLLLVSGLVKEDVARLGVLGDFGRETVEFFDGLRVNFLRAEMGSFWGKH